MVAHYDLDPYDSDNWELYFEDEDDYSYDEDDCPECGWERDDELDCINPQCPLSPDYNPEL